MAFKAHKVCMPLNTVKVLFLMRYNPSQKVLGPQGLALVMMKQETIAGAASKQLS